MRGPWEDWGELLLPFCPVWLMFHWFCSGEGFRPHWAAHLSKERHEGNWPTVQCLHRSSQEVEDRCGLNTSLTSLIDSPLKPPYLRPDQPRASLPPPECDHLGRPERWWQLHHHQRLEGSSVEERSQVLLADRGRAGHNCSPEDALCLWQVRESVQRHRPQPQYVNNVFPYVQTGSSCTAERLFPALFQDQLNHSTLKKPSISASKRWSSAPDSELVLVHISAWCHSSFFVVSQALEVSDHFPVEVDLRPNHRYLLRNELWSHQQSRFLFN